MKIFEVVIEIKEEDNPFNLLARFTGAYINSLKHKYERKTTKR